MGTAAAVGNAAAAVGTAAAAAAVVAAAAAAAAAAAVAVTNVALQVNFSRSVSVVVMRWYMSAAELRRGVYGCARTNKTLLRHQDDHHSHLQCSSEISMCQAVLRKHPHFCEKVLEGL